MSRKLNSSWSVVFLIAFFSIQADNATATDGEAVVPPSFLGSQSCATSGCHSGAGDKNKQYTVWAKYDVHHERPFATLTTARSERIAETLKLGDPTKSDRCTSCHAPMQTVPEERFAKWGDHGREPQQIKAAETKAGISCENCHGPAENWILAHTRKDYTHVDRVHAGMRDLQNLYVRANTCVACHQNVDADILAAGHPKLIFELDGQCVTQPKHWQETTNWNGAQAWLVGQAVALREMSWQLVSVNTPNPTDNQINRWKAIEWLLADSAFPISVDCNGSLYFCGQQKGENLARAASGSGWSDTIKDKALSNLAGRAADFRDSSVSQPLQARRAERLVLALDRLVMALPKAEQTEPLNSSLKRLFADAQSLPDFNPAQFADHLDQFSRALPR